MAHICGAVALWLITLFILNLKIITAILPFVQARTKGYRVHYSYVIDSFSLVSLGSLSLVKTYFV